MPLLRMPSPQLAQRDAKQYLTRRAVPAHPSEPVMPNSLVPVCVSTGIRPVSCKMTMNSAAAAGAPGR